MSIFKKIGKIAKKAVKAVAPIASAVAPFASFIPGVGTAASMALAGVGMLAGGGDRSQGSYQPQEGVVNPGIGQSYSNAAGGIAAANQQLSGSQEAVNNIFSRFTPEYYNRIRDTTTDSLLRKEEDRYKKESNTLAAALARNGITRSSVAVDENADAQEASNRRRMDAVLQGEQAVLARRRDIESQRANALGLSQSGASFAPAAIGDYTQSGANYVAPEGGSLGTLIGAISDSDALKRYKTAQQGKLTKQKKQAMAPTYTNAKVVAKKFKSSPRFASMAGGTNARWGAVL